MRLRSKMLSFLNIYWIFTLFYYCFGKVRWNIPSYLLLVSYTLICYLFINLGYFSVKMKYPYLEVINYRYLKLKLFRRYKLLFRICCISMGVFQISWIFIFMGKFEIFDIISNLGSNYFLRLDLKFDEVNIIMKIRTLFWIATYFVYPLGFFFYKNMNKKDKVLFLMVLLIDVFASLNMGVSKNIGDIIILLIAVILLNDSIFFRKKFQKREGRKKVIMIIVGIFILFLIFSIIQEKRFEHLGKYTMQIHCDPNFGTVRENSIVDVLLFYNNKLVYLVHSLCNYFSSSYTALALSFDLPFKTTYGLGFSRALMEYFEQYFGVVVEQNTYCQQLEDVYGWLNGISWPTAFVWIANSVSLIGVPFVMFFLGRIWCKAEVSWKRDRKVIGLVVYCQLVIAFIYLPCNAQIVQSRQSFIATTFMFIIFFTRNINFNLKNVRYKKTKKIDY